MLRRSALAVLWFAAIAPMLPAESQPKTTVIRYRFNRQAIWDNHGFAIPKPGSAWNPHKRRGWTHADQWIWDETGQVRCGDPGEPPWRPSKDDVDRLVVAIRQRKEFLAQRYGSDRLTS
jgi:hypothetical protein